MFTFTYAALRFIYKIFLLRNNEENQNFKKRREKSDFSCVSLAVQRIVVKLKKGKSFSLLLWSQSFTDFFLASFFECIRRAQAYRSDFKVKRSGLVQEDCLQIFVPVMNFSVLINLSKNKEFSEVNWTLLIVFFKNAAMEISGTFWININFTKL